MRHGTIWGRLGPECCLRFAVVFGLAAACARAEPSVSGSHLPIVWTIAILGAVAMAALPPAIKKYAKLRAPRWAIVTASVLLVVLWSLFVAPLIIVLGSILLTGRTM
ncbi:MAG: hypothetical protein HUU46_08245 [Candidatus Hydrogenedentes bacterium]|nr:hypothetical protein [Candidatus Hydrogenedentota bacterium]